MDKRAVSEMVTYVLLISLAVAMAGGVYAWLRFYVNPNVFPEQSCEITLVIEDYNCSGNIFNLTVQNRGRFDVEGYIIKINNGTRDYTIYDYRYLLSYVPPKISVGESSNGLFNYTVFKHVNATEIEAVKGFDKNGRPILCKDSIVRQDISGC
jgi:hypothetical protein